MRSVLRSVLRSVRFVMGKPLKMLALGSALRCAANPPYYPLCAFAPLGAVASTSPFCNPAAQSYPAIWPDMGHGIPAASRVRRRATLTLTGIFGAIWRAEWLQNSYGGGPLR